ncbi:MAG: hypothetical protein HC898_07185, partial [Phycisphaerales bacterium]|nr:hypothetical protein [Phycisphaerales bacterium]
VCPVVPDWSITEELNRPGSSSTNSDYYFTPGYYGNGSGTSMTSYWTRSENPWFYDNRRMTVVAGDKSYFNTYIIVNHTQNLPNAYQWRPGAFGGFAYRLDTSDDTVRYQSPTNHSFIDGSARSVNGSDKLIPVNGLWGDRPNANYLMPFD